MNSERYRELEHEIIERYDKEGLSDAVLSLFRECIWSYYAGHGRVLPWRETHDPYRILVSEIMLQQTQVPRVLEKYREFIAAFPDFEALALAPLRDVLAAWQGLGYNRRAVALKNTALIVVEKFDGTLPADYEELKKLPGIGPATAAAVMAYAFNQAVPFIETNIRAVYIHFFFHDQIGITDKALMPLIEGCLDTENPREWNYALMDYGVMLKKTRPNPSRKSAHHKVQSPFEGSHRQLRARTLRLVLEHGTAGAEDVAHELEIEQNSARDLLEELSQEGFIKEDRGIYRAE